MDLRVLVYMNPLVVDKISKKFLWEKDSGFLYTKQLMGNLPSNWRFTILVPKGFDNEFFPNAECVEYDYSTSIHQNRYHFNRNILAKTFPYGRDIDVIINNQPEVTANLRVFFQNQRREKPIIVNLFHWIDCEESAKFSKELSGYIWRQIDGVINADISLFHTPYAKELFEKSMEKTIGTKIKYEYGLFQPRPTKFGDKPIELPKKKIILFNHRLNNTTGWKEVVICCDMLKHRGRDDFILWLTDDQNLKERKWLEEFDFIKIQRMPFESYGYLIKNSHFSVCNIKGYATWNMAVLDSIYNGCVPLVPPTRLFLDMFYGHAPAVYGNLEDSIESMLNKTKEETTKYLERIVVQKDDFLGKWVEKQIIERIEGKNIKKYNDVKSYIISTDKCEKRDFVNKFWSFHANSNFQLIRWKLLNDGLKDDTTEKNTVYHNVYKV